MAELVAQQARSRKKSAGGRRFRRVLPSVRRLGALAAVAAVAISGLTLVSPGVGTAPAEALFATGGEGEHRNSIDWFSFEAEGPVIPGPDGTITYTNEREAGHHTLRTTCTVGDITGTTANPLSTYRSGGYVGDALPTLYNIGGPGSQNEMITGFVNTVTSTFAQFRIVCSADIIDNDTQVSTEMPLQGLVVADAESSNTVGLTHEYIQVSPIANQSFGDAATAAPGVNWRVMDRYRPANCPSFTEARVLPNTSMLNLETNGSECMANEVGNAGPGPIAVAFMEGATSADITVNGGGSTAVAIGMVLDTDFGDAPESYGEAGAFYEPTWAGDIIPANAELVNLSDESFQLATRGSPVRTLGERIDPETKQLHSHDALLDDETGVSDEDGIDPKMLPPLNTAAGQNNEIEVSCTVAPGETALLAGWIDWAHNGVFDPEDRSDTVACVNGTATLTWTVPEVEGQSTAESRTMLRLRIAETEAELTPTGLAHSGEVEDYSLESPRILATKTATPPEGTTLHPGEQVTYTLDFWNDSSVPGDVTYSDQLAEVLDNARLVGGPTMEVGGPEVTALLTGTQIDVVGRLAPDAKARVTYTVEVTAEATHGERLTNYLLLSDGSGTIVEDPPGLCLPENPRCTDHPIAVPGLYVTKLADPVSGETVTAGEHITYQLLFENWGPEPVAIEHTDDLTRVLDDATLLEETVHGVGGLDASFQNGSQSLAITGSVPAGKIGMVRYTVEVKEDGERGDDELANFLLESGSTPPTTCAPESDTCTTHPVATSDISVAKRVKGRENGSAVVAGDELTYELTFTNQGAAAGPVDHVDHLAGVLDDAELTAGPTVAPEGALSAVLDEDAQTIAITGQLAAGASVTVSYTVTVKADDDRGDDVLANFVMEGETQPPTVCEPGMDNCTTHPAEKPNVTDEKSVDPESGTGVTAGQELTYTLSFTNSGSVPGAVNRIDDLRHVLDDAEVTTPPTASDPALTPVFDAAAQTIAVTGELAPGQTVTVSYVVTVKPDGERGDDTLANFLLDPGQDPPTTPVCDPEDTDCTGNPIGAISYEKRVDASADPITAGAVLTYTVEMRNTGTATAAVQRTDVLTDVLDDAELTEEPASNTPSVTVSEVVDERFTIGGELATVTYAVTVKAAADRGNHSAANFLVTEPGTEPPGECLPADPECTVTGLPDLRVSKQVDPESGTAVAAGQELRYTLTFANEGDGAAPVDFLDDLSGVLDDAEVTSEPTVDPEGTLTATRTAAELAISGTVPANSSVTVRYAVTVKADGQRGDSELANFLVETGTEPPTTCEPGDPCTVNPVPELTVTKSSDPASGEAVAAGEELTYTLSFSNTGAAPAALAFTDSLAGVFDDAELTGGPTVLGAGGQVVTAVFDGAAEEITITGSVPPLKIVEVTYTVTVKADGERGDNQLANFLLETGVEPPTVCLPEDEACTVHPVPELVVAKTASPASGEAVIAGQTVSYELSFENAGTAPVSVAHTDHLAGVLDDADFGEGPTVRPSGALTAARDGEEIAITGTLAPGARATVSYTVTVKADGERGDEQLGNFLTETGVEPPTTCAAEDETCTEHPVLGADVSVQKTSNPADGQPVIAGQAVDYTLTFTNSGGAVGAVDWTDDLSGVLDDAGITKEPVADPSGALTATRTGAKIRVVGDLAAGDTVTVRYQVTVKKDGERGDDLLGNVIVETGTTPPGECLPEDEHCTEHPVHQPDISATKTSDPAPGTVLLAGEEVTYALTFTNAGDAAGPVDFVDVLTKIVDQATQQGDVTVSDPALTAALDPADPELLRVTGDLAAGQQVTVTYTFRLNPELPHGERMQNFLLTGAEWDAGLLPGVCLPENPRCTDHPAVMPDLDVWKTADPASGEAVSAGQEVTYTLHFRNYGPASAFVKHSDSLVDVLDDAEMVTPPTVSGAPLHLSYTDAPGAEVLRLTGELRQSDGEVTVSYTVRVKPDADREREGNHSLANAILADGEEPPITCAPETPNCTVHPVPNIEAEKRATPTSGETVSEGQEITYSLSFRNSGTAPGPVAHRDSLSDVLDDAELIAGPTVSGEGVTATLVGDDIVIAGQLAAGAEASVDYTVRVRPDAERALGGNNLLANVLVAEGTEPPTVCEPGDTGCTWHPVPLISAEKSVDPESGSVVAPGQTVTYSLLFRNTGTASGTVAYEDLLSGVLDDAVLTEGPTVTSGGVTADLDGERLVIGGSLDAGAEATVSYTVRVLTAAERGDHVLANVVLKPGTEPPTVCEPETGTCTVNPVGEIVATKAVDPASGTTVSAGDTLRYTLTFRNVGAGAAVVSAVDDLTDVLDDADLVAAPVATGALRAEGPEQNELRISGTLAGGAVETVRYSVTVRDAAEQGNGLLANVLLESGEKPPTTCEPESERCTQNPVAPPVTPPTTPPGVTQPPLGETGGASPLPWVLGGSGVLLAGAALIWLARRRAAGRNPAEPQETPGDPLG